MCQDVKWSTIPLFKGLDSKEISEVIRAGKILKLKADEYVFRAGDEGNEMYVIISGSIRVEKVVGGSKQIVAKFKSGQIFGEIAFVANILRTADIIAEVESEVLEISGVFLQELIEKLPQTAAKTLFNLSLILCERLANTTRYWIDSEYENILILFQTLASETDVEAVFNKFTAVLVKALPRIKAVEFLCEDRRFFWTTPGFEPVCPDFDFLQKQQHILVDVQDHLTICPIKIEGRPNGYLLLFQEPGMEFSTKELNLLTEVTAQLGRIIHRIFLDEERKTMATKDPLTGLYNRRVFKEKLAQEIMRAGRFGSPLSLLVADLDHFKEINDTYGHLAGDETLRQIAALIKDSVRKDDTPCRYGGEEFAIILPAANATDALAIAERLRKSVGQYPIRVGDFRIQITISIGIAVYQGESAEDLFEKADRATYSSKINGRDRVSLADGDRVI